MRELSRADARRVAVRAQLLDARRPDALLEAAAGLGAIQVDITAYLAPSADLVVWSRLGDRTSRDDLAEAIDGRDLVEVQGFLRRCEDIALFTAEMAAWPGADPPAWRAGLARWVEQNDHAREQVLQVLRSEGPLPARAIDVEVAVGWRSSGWNHHKNIPMLLERMSERGEVAVSHREGKERIWDLAERIYPAVAPVPLEQALRIRAERRLRSLGIARARTRETPVEPLAVGEVGERVRVEGLRGHWQVDPALLDDDFAPRTALLSPLDRLVFDRKRMEELFAFDYALEMYKPAVARRWGYYALPVLHGDRLVGKVDAEADRRHGQLHVHAVHADEPWPAAVRDGVEAELASLGRYLDLEVLLP